MQEYFHERKTTVMINFIIQIYSLSSSVPKLIIIIIIIHTHTHTQLEEIEVFKINSE